MTQRSNSELKAKFQFGSVPSADDFSDLIDSMVTTEIMAAAIAQGDADMVDGEHSSAFSHVGHTHAGTEISSKVAAATDSDELGGYAADEYPRLETDNEFQGTQTIRLASDVPALELFPNPDQNANLIDVYNAQGNLDSFMDQYGRWLLRGLTIRRDPDDDGYLLAFQAANTNSIGGFTKNAALHLAALSDVDAENGTIYYSLTQASVVFKTLSGTIVLIPGVGGGSGTTELYAKIIDQKATGVSGGNYSSGVYSTRVLNTLAQDEIGISLSNNVFTLPAGKYRLSARAQAHFVSRNRIRLVNDDTNSTVILGPSMYCDTFDIDATLEGVVSLTEETAFRLEHYMQTSRGFGDDGGVQSGTGEDEIYATVDIYKLG